MNEGRPRLLPIKIVTISSYNLAITGGDLVSLGLIILGVSYPICIIFVMCLILAWVSSWVSFGFWLYLFSLNQFTPVC